MLIVIEGLDGSGKSTQVRLLKEHIINSGKKLRYIHFPRFTTPVYGDLLARFLRGEFGTIEDVHPQLVALLFAEDRRLAASEIRQALADGEVVLLDRYVYSNIAFQCAKMPDADGSRRLKEWILDTEYVQFGIPRPDVNIFLDVPISFVSKKLSSARKGDDRAYLEGADDIHESDIEFQKKVRASYLEQVGEDPDFIRVDCSGEDGSMLPVMEIHGRIIHCLNEKQ